MAGSTTYAHDSLVCPLYLLHAGLQANAPYEGVHTSSGMQLAERFLEHTIPITTVSAKVRSYYLPVFGKQ